MTWEQDQLIQGVSNAKRANNREKGRGKYHQGVLISICSFPDHNKLMLVGGTDNDNGNPLRGVEVIDFSDENLNCSVSAPYPFEVEEAVAMYWTGRNAWVCGGWGRPDSQGQNPVAVSECIRYEAETRSWKYTASMNDPRRRAAGLALNSESVWITGGMNEYQVLQTTEIFQVSPLKRSDNCVCVQR